jgi:D-alanyl-D-alanine carboxypeptidase
VSTRTRRWPILAAVALLAVFAALAVVLAATRPEQAGRAERQDILDDLVAGADRVAPGAAAYVIGPDGAWSGAAGVADLGTGAPMRSDARTRIQSLSKTWLLVVMLQLAQERKLDLDESVADWAGDLLPRHARQITIRELLTDSSGLIDDNDVDSATPAQRRAMLARIKDPALRAKVLATAARLRRDPTIPVSPRLWIRLADWQPLVAAPGERYHHSNIGWNLAGMIAARAGGAPLSVLYRERIFGPLHLTRTAYDPQGPIRGPHATGYLLRPGGRAVDATAWTFGKGADGAIVTDAQDEATFLRAIVDDRLHVRRSFLEFTGTTGQASAGCPGNAFSGSGAGSASRAYALYDQSRDGRVAVLLLNGARQSTLSSTSGEDVRTQAAARQLFCGG